MRRAVAWGLACCFGMITISSLDAQAQNAVLTLDHGWQFRQLVAEGGAADGGWLPATVPGDVHLDLLANKRIPDPYYRDNEAKLQWIEQASWEYETSFDAGAALVGKANVELVFDGLDAAAEVDLNDVLVLSADNMFRVWRVPVKERLHAGKNVLRVVFPSPIKAAEKVAATDPWQPKTKTEAKTYIRKAAYEYGWDWGPRFVTSGIWKPVRIEGWDKVRIADFAIRQRDVSKEVAHLDAQVEIESASDEQARVLVDYLGTGRPLGGKPPYVVVNVTIHRGLNTIDVPVEVPKPDLWFPTGYGQQARY